MAKNKTEQGAKSKKVWIIVAVVVVILAAIAGNTNNSYTQQKDEQSETSTQNTEQSSTQQSEQQPETTEPEANTSAKVDALAREAKAAAEGITDEKRDEAVTFIVEHYPDYYTDNETMEQAMAYGFLLEYAYNDDEAARDYAELGMDVAQAVKYVYRGAETVEDDATQENLRQIKETLAKLGHDVE